MNTPVIFAYASAAFAGMLALGGAFRARRSVSRWAFVAGMAVLALERVCTGLSAGTPLLANMDYWKGGGLIAAAFLPGVWLLFSLTYARGNAREFLTRWRLALAAAFVLPPALGLLFRGSLIVEIYQLEAGPPLLRLGPAGVALYALLLIAAVLVLMNLERTYRASVGTMRWRIKFMLLGVGLIFVVRLYTNSQALLFRGVDPSLAVLDSGALLVAALLVLRFTCWWSAYSQKSSYSWGATPPLRSRRFSCCCRWWPSRSCCNPTACACIWGALSAGNFNGPSTTIVWCGEGSLKPRPRGWSRSIYAGRWCG
jgi:hypothetical protein